MGCLDLRLHERFSVSSQYAPVFTPLRSFPSPQGYHFRTASQSSKVVGMKRVQMLRGHWLLDSSTSLLTFSAPPVPYAPLSPPLSYTKYPSPSAIPRTSLLNKILFISASYPSYNFLSFASFSPFGPEFSRNQVNPSPAAFVFSSRLIWIFSFRYHRVCAEPPTRLCLFLSPVVH